VSKKEGQRTVPDCVVGVVDNAQVGAVHTLSKRTKAETHVHTIVYSGSTELGGVANHCNGSWYGV
jgi:hypothetical protein